MVDEGLGEASNCPLDDDSLVNLPFSFALKDKAYEDERFKDISVKDGFHGYNGVHFSYDNDGIWIVGNWLKNPYMIPPIREV